MLYGPIGRARQRATVEPCTAVDLLEPDRPSRRINVCTPQAAEFCLSRIPMGFCLSEIRGTRHVASLTCCVDTAADFTKTKSHGNST
jgi:hypothetical protein